LCGKTAVIAVFRALPPARRIEPPAVRAREVSALSRPSRSLPGQNKEPSVKTLVVCSGGLDSVTLAHKVAVDQTVIPSCLVRLRSLQYRGPARKLAASGGSPH
jgi:hypothetical protein